MLTHNYTYKACLNTSSRVYWDLNELFEGESFDFTKRWLPEEWANVDGISCLTGDEKLKLNQILGFTYYYYFDFAEEFITAQIIEQVRNHRFGDETKLRAMLRFADGESKHQAMVQRALPFRGQLGGSLFDATLCLTLAGLEEAGELAFEAESEGSVGDQSGEPIWSHTNHRSYRGGVTARGRSLGTFCM